MSLLQDRKVEPLKKIVSGIDHHVRIVPPPIAPHKLRKFHQPNGNRPSAHSVAENPIPLSEDREPWEKQPGEPQKYYKLFQIWLDLAEERLERNLRETSRRTGVGYSFMRALHKLWRWDERAAAYDHYAAKLKYQAKLRIIEEMAERQARRGLITASIGLQVILELRKRIKNGQLKKATLKELRSLTRPALMAIRLGQEEERYARGVSKAIITPQSKLVDPTDEGQQVRAVVEAVLSLKPTPELDAAIDGLDHIIQTSLREAKRQADAITSIPGEYKLLEGPDCLSSPATTATAALQQQQN